MPILVSLTRPILQIFGKTQTGVFSISGFLVNPLSKKIILTWVTKLDKRNKATSKMFYDKVMSANCEVIVVFPIYVKFRVIPKPHSGYVVKLTFLLIVIFYLTKTENRTKKISNIALTLVLWVTFYFCQKWWFLQKNADISRIKKVLVL